MLHCSIDLGTICNLNCVYCFTQGSSACSTNKNVTPLTDAELTFVLNDLACAGVRTVSVVGAGEPTLSSSFFRFVSRATELDMAVVLFTNGIALSQDSKLVSFLFDVGAAVVMKLNSRRPELQDAVVGRKGYAAVRDRALKELIRTGYNASDPTRLGVDTLVFKGNLSEVPEIHRWCRENNVYPLTAEFIPAGRTTGGFAEFGIPKPGLDSTMRVIAEEALRPISSVERSGLVQTLRQIDDHHGIVQAGERAYFGGGPCTQLLGVYVDFQGQVWPCVAKRRLLEPFDKPIGSIRSGDKPSDAWRRSPYLQWLRDSYTGACPYKPLLKSSDI